MCYDGIYCLRKDEGMRAVRWRDWISDGNSHPYYDLQDLIYDCPHLFDDVYNNSVEALTGFGFDSKAVWAYQIEVAEITAAQWEALDGQPIKRANRFDYEMGKIEQDLFWAGIQPTDTVEVVFWQDNFDPLVSFANRTKHQTVHSLLNVRYEELREAGFSGDFISKIAVSLRSWADGLLEPEELGNNRPKESVDAQEAEESDTKNEIVMSLMSMFFADSDNEGSEADDEQHQHPAAPDDS